MADKPELTVVYADGYEALYVDGVFVADGDRIAPDQVAAAAGVSLDYLCADPPWLSVSGSYPRLLSDVIPAGKGALDAGPG